MDCIGRRVEALLNTLATRRAALGSRHDMPCETVSMRVLAMPYKQQAIFSLSENRHAAQCCAIAPYELSMRLLQGLTENYLPLARCGISPVGRNRAALRRRMSAGIRNRLNPRSTIVPPGASATLVVFYESTGTPRQLSAGSAHCSNLGG